jgi:hypothetical protein
MYVFTQLKEEHVCLHTTERGTCVSSHNWKRNMCVFTQLKEKHVCLHTTERGTCVSSHNWKRNMCVFTQLKEEHVCLHTTEKENFESSNNWKRNMYVFFCVLCVFLGVLCMCRCVCAGWFSPGPLPSCKPGVLGYVVCMSHVSYIWVMSLICISHVKDRSLAASQVC